MVREADDRLVTFVTVNWLAYLVSLFVFGLIIGLGARLLVRRSGVQGCIMTSLLGIAGSLIGGIIGRLIFGDDSLLAGYLLSFLGAVLLALLVRVTDRDDGRAPHPPD